MAYIPGQDGPLPTGEPTGQDPAWVQQWYQNFFGRPPSSEELSAATQPGFDFAALANSPESLTYLAKTNPGPTPPVAHETPTAPGAPPPVGGPPAPSGPPPTTTTGPAYTPPPAFHYDDFQDPTGQDVLNDKGYQFELGQGMDAIGRKNAALGTLNTGGTIGDFMRFGTDLAGSKYGDIWNRKLADYSTNRANAVGVYNQNYATQYQDPYSISQHNWDSNKAMDFNQWVQQYNMGRDNRNDVFDQRYRILGLL